MGTWGTAIKSNDTSADIYADFFDLYNDGKEPNEIKKKLISDNPNGTNDFWFTLALALWETKSLSNDILEKVREIIKSESDLKVWKELDASESDIKKRKIVLEKFLTKLESEKAKPKARKRISKKEPIFKKGSCLIFKLDNGNYGGGIVLESDFETGFGYNLIVSTRINQASSPTVSDFKKCNVLVASFGHWKNEPKVTWYLPKRFKKEFSELFENIGEIPIELNYTPNGSEIRASFSTGWQNIIEPINQQLEHEKTNEITKSFSIEKLIKRKKWWQFK
ncbi:hypothetical protein [Aquimarina sp. MAR_2010_214]|uniref:hypothetical protein n=1 Tax=Aquimarina sp. MAR_2010_214 TaxID=1250026 RepID=UPI000C70C3B4|nr:hypothetical protein [Aquimarina sp. MAR_2010_214]